MNFRYAKNYPGLFDTTDDREIFNIDDLVKKRRALLWVGPAYPYDLRNRRIG